VFARNGKKRCPWALASPGCSSVVTREGNACNGGTFPPVVFENMTLWSGEQQRGGEVYKLVRREGTTEVRDSGLTHMEEVGGGLN